jgi:tetratricopeptide (TPR) repeat protein
MQVQDEASVAGDRPLELLARSELATQAFWRGEQATEELQAIAHEAIPLFEATGDDEALVDLWEALATVDWGGCRYAEVLSARRRRLEHARRTGQARLERQAMTQIGPCLYFGPAPVGEALAWFEQHPALTMRPGHTWRASLLGLLGRFEEAHAALVESERQAQELGNRFAAAAVAIAQGEVDLLAGDPVSAERRLRAGCEAYEELGQLGVLSTYITLWARALYLLGRDAEADEKTRRSEDLGASDDVITQAAWRQERARVVARRGECAEAGRLARDAVARMEQTDMLIGRGDAFDALADVLEFAGDADGAAAALERALAEYERKGAAVLIDKTRVRLAGLRAPA